MTHGSIGGNWLGLPGQITPGKAADARIEDANKWMTPI